MFDYVQVALSLLLLASLGGNLFFYFRLQNAPVKRFYDAHALMQDLDRYGQALIKVTRVDPDDVVIRSPRDRK